MDKPKPEKMIQRKYCIVGICQFCGKDGYVNEEKRDCRDDIQRGWFGLFDVAAQVLAVHGEWCSMECFWNDMLCQTTAESVNDYIKRKNELLKQLRKENRAVQKVKAIGNGHYFGHCPDPEHENYYLNINRGHWMVCDHCKIKWFIGENLFSSWRKEDKALWKANADKIRNYKEVDTHNQNL